MKKLPIVAAIATAALAANASAAVVGYNYDATMTGTAGVINVSAFITPTLIYSAPSANPPVSGDWTFTFVDATHVNFTGNLYLGDYSTYTSATALGSTMTGTISTVGANHAFSGTADWDAGTNTLTYSILGANGSGVATTYTETSSSCTGTGSIFGNTVCGTAGGVDPAWEGLDITLVFSSSDFSNATYTGTIAGTSISGSGLAENTTVFNYTVGGEVPVPAAAWLFGSALLGLGGMARRKRA